MLVVSVTGTQPEGAKKVDGGPQPEAKKVDGGPQPEAKKVDGGPKPGRQLEHKQETPYKWEAPRVVHALPTPSGEPMVRPRLVLAARVWRRLSGLIQLAPGEFSAMCTVEERLGALYVDQVVIPRQENGPSRTEFSDVGDHPLDLAACVYEMYQQDPAAANRLRLWFHSHSDFGVFMSGPDEQTVRELLGPGVPYIVSVVANRAGQWLALLNLGHPRLVLPMDVAYEEEAEAGLEEELRKLVAERMVPLRPKYPSNAYDLDLEGWSPFYTHDHAHGLVEAEGEAESEAKSEAASLLSDLEFMLSAAVVYPLGDYERVCAQLIYLQKRRNLDFDVNQEVLDQEVLSVLDVAGLLQKMYRHLDIEWCWTQALSQLCTLVEEEGWAEIDTFVPVT